MSILAEFSNKLSEVSAKVMLAAIAIKRCSETLVQQNLEFTSLSSQNREAKHTLHQHLILLA
ncbi:hypothetical protein H6H01_30115 [Nostoc calcicola FACHB-3891]|nr:hypothetical protein [Nostoc calcicola FACHB-3891]